MSVCKIHTFPYAPKNRVLKKICFTLFIALACPSSSRHLMYISFYISYYANRLVYHISLIMLFGALGPLRIDKHLWTSLGTTCCIPNNATAYSTSPLLRHSAKVGVRPFPTLLVMLLSSTPLSSEYSG